MPDHFDTLCIEGKIYQKQASLCQIGKPPRVNTDLLEFKKRGHLSNNKTFETTTLGLEQIPRLKSFIYFSYFLIPASNENHLI